MVEHNKSLQLSALRPLVTVAEVRQNCKGMLLAGRQLNSMLCSIELARTLKPHGLSAGPRGWSCPYN